MIVFLVLAIKSLVTVMLLTAVVTIFAVSYNRLRYAFAWFWLAWSIGACSLSIIILIVIGLCWASKEPECGPYPPELLSVYCQDK